MYSTNPRCANRTVGILALSLFTKTESHSPMFDEQARAFLQKPLTARIATNDPSGYPHVVPVWFKLEGDEIVMVSERETRKTRNLRANPKASFSIGGDSDDDAGYLIRCEVASI